MICLRHIYSELQCLMPISIYQYKCLDDTNYSEQYWVSFFETGVLTRHVVCVWVEAGQENGTEACTDTVRWWVTSSAWFRQGMALPVDRGRWGCWGSAVVVSGRRWWESAWWGWWLARPGPPGSWFLRPSFRTRLVAAHIYKDQKRSERVRGWTFYV